MHVPGVDAEIVTALLDVDGTLIDSNAAHARAWVDAFHEAGYDVAFATVRPMIGMGGDKILPAIDPSLADDREPGKTIARRRGEIFLSHYLGGLMATRGARDLLVILRNAGIACIAATSAKESELDAILAQAGVKDLIGTKSTADDASASKPAPDIIQAALHKGGADPAHSVMLGDTKYDVAAAAKAGVPAIALRCGGSSDADLQGAAAIYDDPLSLVAATRIS